MHETGVVDCSPRKLYQEGAVKGGAVVSAEIKWTSEQLAIIQAGVSEKLLVDAGPGTGKTAVLCARIAHLLEHGTEPGEIWIVSFTRTAISELKDRVARSLQDPARAAGIRIATIDSHAWAIQSGFAAGSKPEGGYEESIQRVIELVKGHAGVFEYIGGVRHLFVDEAQDVVGLRVELLLELIYALPKDAGVTVFCDEAQAIYGFSEDAQVDAVEGTLPESIREYMPDFRALVLSQIHRTSDRVLQSLYTDGRRMLLQGKEKARSTFESLQKLIAATNHGDCGSFRTDLESNVPESMDTFLLFRSRADALRASCLLGDAPHRLRMSGLPAPVDAWIGQILWDCVGGEIALDDFKARWKERIGDIEHHDPDACWQAIVRFAGKSAKRIDTTVLCRRLASKSPPPELCGDFGFDGPLVGTIHGAKGREASHVRLYLPTRELPDSDEDEYLEEARVLFVGASRAKKTLVVGKGSKLGSTRLQNGRALNQTSYSQRPVEVEIGRANDIDAAGLTGKQFFSSRSKAATAQKRLSSLSRQMVMLEGSISGEDLEYRYAIKSDAWPDVPLMYLARTLNYDMFEIARRIGKHKPPWKLYKPYSMGIRTLAVSSDDPARTALHAPWCDSGFMLAPMITGFRPLFFR